MSTFGIALANLRGPASAEESNAVEQARAEQAGIVCFPECFVPGYRLPGNRAPAPDSAFLKRAWPP